MILLDTNVVIDFRWDLLNQEDCVVCGIVISELYSGIRSKKEEKAVELFVNSLDCLSVEEGDWQKIGQLISNFKKNGLSVPFQDAVLAYLSIKYGCKILTSDKHFPMMKVLDDRIGLWEV